MGYILSASESNYYFYFMTEKTYNIISSILIGVIIGVGYYFDLSLLERILAVIIIVGSFYLLVRKKLTK